MQNLGENLLRYNLDKNKFFTWDCETEGLNLKRSKPWEISWSIYHGEKLVEEHQHFLKWPNLKVSIGAAKATGFNPENINKFGEDPKKIIDLFDKYIYNKEYKIIGANILGYDIYIHNLSRNLLGYKTDYSYLDRIYDTNILSKIWKLGLKIPENKEDFLEFQFKVGSIIQKGLKTNNARS